MSGDFLNHLGDATGVGLSHRIAFGADSQAAAWMRSNGSDMTKEEPRESRQQLQRCNPLVFVSSRCAAV